jgi:soluble cytochrome b562
MTPASEVRMAKCRVCEHPFRATIEERVLLKETTQSAAAEKFEVPQAHISRHMKEHIDGERRFEILAKDAQRKQVQKAEQGARAIEAESVDIREGMAHVVREIDALLKRAKTNGDDAFALASLKEMRHALLDLAKVYGQLQEGVTVKIDLNQSPQWQRLRKVLFEVLDMHPEAKADFITAMRRELPNARLQ